MPDLTSPISRTVNPPITTVSPSLRSTCDSALCFLKVSPTSDGAIRRGPFGGQVEKDVASIGNPWSDFEYHPGFDVVHRCDRKAARASRSDVGLHLCTRVEHAHRGFLANQDPRRAVVHHANRRLRLHIGEFDGLQSIDEADQGAASDDQRSKHRQRRSHNPVACIAQRRDRVASQRHHVRASRDLLRGKREDTVTVGIGNTGREEIELVPPGVLQVVGDAEPFQPRPVDEDDLGGDVHLPHAHIECLYQLGDRIEDPRNVGHDKGIGRDPDRGSPPFRQERLCQHLQLGGLNVADSERPGGHRPHGIILEQLPGVHHADDSVFLFVDDKAVGLHECP